MHATYLIGTLLEINHQSKALIHRGNKNEVTLPASGCYCLQALSERGGDILSLTELMGIGWGHIGVEVTENSVRVMINKIRKAISSLGMQHDIILLTVPRRGYRLLIGNKLQPRTLPETGKNTNELSASVISTDDRGKFKRAVFTTEMIMILFKNIPDRMVVLGCILLVIISITFTNRTILSNYYDKNDMRKGDWYFPVKDADTKSSHYVNTVDYYILQESYLSDG
ncbi:TPA: winged helix-turn-helix domain-containing protein [Serratia liquefaciens]|nr:winged helix-turn-helix domain-containing protein [Serratia liquefaciens]